MTRCWDCWAAEQVDMGPCAKHSTPEQKAEFQRKLTDLSLRPHPVLAMLRRR